MVNPPQVSVYMATKNRAALLCRAIDSVLAQDFTNYELVIVDDGSTDNTPEVLQSYQCRHPHINCLRNDHSQGAATARNQAIALAKGHFITGLDDDDQFSKDRLNILLNAYHDRYSLVCTSVIWDWGNRSKVADASNKIFTFTDQLDYNHATSQVLVRRDRFLAIGGFDQNMDARIDYDAWTRLTEQFGPAKRIDNPCYILGREPGVKRITNSQKNITGNQQFLSKHRSKMTRRNIVNQEFWDLYARNSPIGFTSLIRQLNAGYMGLKLKYYLKCKINWLLQKY